ncbi:MAG: membrane protein insertion efficiency factor YidD [Saprospiraceae bacterium]|nr:membrane protein insertion efficiency factor YidD [Saprospiraceae bacterium]
MPAIGQTPEDFQFSKALAVESHKSTVYTTFKSHIAENQNEIQLLFSGLFFFYKEFLSSQDANKCAFSPSCSLYGIMAVKQNGLIKGGIMTLDRLTRCNGLSPEKYEIDVKNRVLIDPVE